MATKSDLIAAQSFSRRRLLTAFVSGAPGGKELEPAAPLRAVFVAIGLTVVVLLAGVFYGLVRPGLPNGWQNGRMVIAKDSGSRYVTVDGTLHPVINIASARLLIPSGDFGIVSTDQQTLADLKLGSTLGIVGAPDSLPASSALIGDAWSACAIPAARVDVRVGGGNGVATTDTAAVVESGGTRYVVEGQRRYAVDASETDAVLRAAGLASVVPQRVSASWLNLFTPGTPLGPITVADAGKSVPGSGLTVGEVVHVKGSPAAERFLVQPDGTLAKLSPLAWQLYQLGGGTTAATVSEVSAADVAGLGSSAHPAGGADWPAAGFTPMAAGMRPCAQLTHDASGAHSVLATQPDSVAVAAGAHVAAGHGALVRAGGRGDQASGMVTLIDATGTAYGMPGATTETIKRLGYAKRDVGTAPSAWTALFATGPALTEAAAGKTPEN
ncbi:type VII secretion protein EccB [Microbacterium mangrovi]|uniref:type VII secretion protein EccB n=1 Tax=Microbacterium mangrovi TaxID=1348253 RepID=UPI00068F51F4|nr:type VII secretion protein EccB [Microbacterium mangrovi]